jgi:hypothetical protein
MSIIEEEYHFAKDFMEALKALFEEREVAKQNGDYTTAKELYQRIDDTGCLWGNPTPEQLEAKKREVQLLRERPYKITFEINDLGEGGTFSVVLSAKNVEEKIEAMKECYGRHLVNVTVSDNPVAL